MKKTFLFGALTAVALFSACSGGSRTAAESMEKIQRENGTPVGVRAARAGVFSVYRQYPSTITARSESTAYAATSDFVRAVTAKVGDRVARDQTIVQFSRDNATYRQAQANLANAEATYKRSSVLYAQAGISKQEFENATTQYEIAQASFKSATDLVDAKAPIAGVISRIAVRETQNVSAGTALFTVTNSDGYQAIISATLDEVGDLRVGERAFATIRGKRLEGRVTEVSLVMDPVKKAFPATVTFSAENAGLASGIACDVSVEIYRNDRAIVVSRSELTGKGTDLAVFVAEGNAAVARKIAVGRDDGTKFEVSAGLREGELVISDVKDGLKDGDRINVVATDGK